MVYGVKVDGYLVIRSRNNNNNNNNNKIVTNEISFPT